MFRMVQGGNGRVVYYGTVSRQKRGAIEIKGVDYNFEKKANEELAIQMLTPTPDHGVTEGEKVIVTLMPDKDKENFGVAEEILKEGVITIKNDRGNDKVVLIGKIHSMRWNDKHTVLSVNFNGLKDYNGNPYGRESVYQDRNGNTKTSYWLNATLFPSSEKYATYYNAEKAENELNPGDVVAMVLTRKERGQYINHNVAKFEKISSGEAAPAAAPTKAEQPAAQPAPAAQAQPAQPKLNFAGFSPVQEEEMAIFQ